MKVWVTNRCGVTLVESWKIKALARLVMEEGKRGMDLGIALVGKESMRALNLEFAGRDEDTDVLAFDYGSSGEDVEGEVIVSVDRALEEARRREISPEEELFLYVIHGILHLCGFSDNSERERRRMRRKEKAVLRSPRFPRIRERTSR